MDYIRKILYLQERQGEKMRPVRGGTARLIRKKGRWKLEICAGESGFSADAPVLLAGEYENICYAQKCGVLGDWMAEGELSGEAEQFLSEVRFMGILVGNAGHYLAAPDINMEKDAAGFRFSRTRTWCGVPTPTAEDKKPPEAPVFSRGEKSEEVSSESEHEKELGKPEFHKSEREKELGKAELQESEREKELEKAELQAADDGGEVTRFTPMYPFEDDEFDWCYQIQPQDLRCFAAHQWHLAENTFLLQGYYNYRHLIYAHRYGKNYIGVPGQFHRREQYLAARFGFCEFKGTKRKRVTVGDYGYWLYEMDA